jgi:hypothetical protein
MNTAIRTTRQAAPTDAKIDSRFQKRHDPVTLLESGNEDLYSA